MSGTLLRGLAPVVASGVAFVFSPVAKDHVSLSWNEYFYLFHFGIFAFLCAWSCGVHPLIGYTLTILLTSQAGLDIAKQINNGHLADLLLPLLSFLVLHFLICHVKRSAEVLNELKTLWIDWIVMIIFFPVFSFCDLLMDTNLFFWLLGYFSGATFVSLAFLKAAEQLWTFLFPLPSTDKKQDDPPKRRFKDVMTFVHKMTISRYGWEEIRFMQLVLCLYGLYWNMTQKMFSEWDQVERWQWAFVCGVASTLWVYLGPIASGSSLSLEELRKITDRLMLSELDEYK